MRPPRPSLRRHRLLALALAATALGVAAGPAQAGPCTAEDDLTRPYLLDGAQYFVAPGGDFEGPDTSWTTAGGAALAQDGHLGLLGGEQVLALPARASGLSPAFCVDESRPHLRLDVRSRSLLGGRLLIEAVRADGTELTLAALPGLLTQLWAPSPRIPLAPPLALGPDDAEHVRLRITALGGGWRIDDVMIDPYKQR